MEETKMGARHSSQDMQILGSVFEKAGQIQQHMKEMGHMEKLPLAGDVYKSDTVMFGSEVKALGNGKVGGYLVRFSDENSTDIAGDFFASDTDYGEAKSSPIYYHHALDKTLGNKKLGMVALKMDDVGVWAEGQIEMADKYMAMVYKMVEKGKLGWSSGTASHLVRRKKVGEAQKIEAWPLGLDASLTPTPAEPRNTAMELKSIQSTDILAETPEGVTEDSNVVASVVEASLNNQLKGITMTQEEKDQLLKEAVDNMKAAQIIEAKKVEDEKKAAEANQAMIDAAVKKALEAYPAVNAGGLKGGAPAVLKTTPGDSAEKAFGWFLKTGDASGIHTGESYNQFLSNGGPEAYKTTYPLVEATQYQGAEAVPVEVYAGIVTRRDPLSVVRAAGAQIFKANSSSINIPIEKASPDPFVIAAENNTYDQLTSQPLDKAVLTIYNYTRTVSLGTQLLEDSVFSITDWWMGYIARGMALTENQEFLVGDNSGNPQGAVTGSTLGVTTASATAITAAEVVQQYFKIAAEYRDNAVWVMAGATEGGIRALTASTSFPFTGTGGYAGGTGNLGLSQGAGWLVSPQSRVFNSASMDAITASKKPILFGNFQAGYAIAERTPMTVVRDPYSAAVSGLVKIISSFRVGGAVTNAVALYHVLTPSA